MKNKRDYYDVLGVQRSADERAIKAAYRKLGKLYHPDANPDDADAEAMMKEVNEAYEVLSDKEKRAHYDQHGHMEPGHGKSQRSGDPFPGGGFGGPDFTFGDYFSRGFGDYFRGGKSSGEAERGKDVKASINIGYGEAISGTEREVAYSFSEKCASCGGTGSIAGISAEDCKQCNGSGRERVTTKSAFGNMTQMRGCSVCGGRGKAIADPCLRCSGNGVLRERKRVLVKVPKGIRNGQSIRLKGLGGPGKQGEPHGNLLVKVNVRP